VTPGTNKWEKEALALFRDLEREGDYQLAMKILKTLLEHGRERADQEWGIPDESIK